MDPFLATHKYLPYMMLTEREWRILGPRVLSVVCKPEDYTELCDLRERVSAEERELYRNTHRHYSFINDLKSQVDFVFVGLTPQALIKNSGGDFASLYALLLHLEDTNSRNLFIERAFNGAIVNNCRYDRHHVVASLARAAIAWPIFRRNDGSYISLDEALYKHYFWLARFLPEDTYGLKSVTINGKIMQHSVPLTRELHKVAVDVFKDKRQHFVGIETWHKFMARVVQPHNHGSRPGPKTYTAAIEAHEDSGILSKLLPKAADKYYKQSWKELLGRHIFQPALRARWVLYQEARSRGTPWTKAMYRKFAKANYGFPIEPGRVYKPPDFCCLGFFLCNPCTKSCPDPKDQAIINSELYSHSKFEPGIDNCCCAKTFAMTCRQYNVPRDREKYRAFITKYVGCCLAPDPMKIYIGDVCCEDCLWEEPCRKTVYDEFGKIIKKQRV